MTGHHAREGHRLRVREVIGSQRDIFGTFDVEWQCEGVLSVRSTSSGSVRACCRYARRRVAVWAALPPGPERTVSVRSTSSGSVRGTATRA